MLDFYEGWELRNRLITDGFLSPDENANDGKAMDLKIEKLAREHYNWRGKEPSDKQIIDVYREMLEQQTANDRLGHIWDIAIDYDGYRTYRGCAALLDEIIECAEVKTKSNSELLNEISVFNKYGCDTFLNSKINDTPYYWAFPPEAFDTIKRWCSENGCNAIFECFNRDDEGRVVAMALKIEKEEETK